MAFSPAQEEPSEESSPVRALLVTGGCCHDYETQKAILTAGIGERTEKKVEWTIVHQGHGESDVKIPLFEEAGWAEGYDIVIHNHCFTRVRDRDYVERILAPHRAGKPAVLIHGTMHSFRTGDEKWFEFCGVTSPGHGSHHAFEVEPLPSESGILEATDGWTISKGELYFVDKVWPGVEPLAEAMSEDTSEKEVLAWTHRYGPEKARVFGTTLGNFNETMIEPPYLDMVAKGFLWALDGSVGENFVEKAPEDSLKSITLTPPAPGLPMPGKNLVSDAIASAVSKSGEEGPVAGAALDGDVATQWLAGSAGPTSWLCSLENPATVGAVALIWNEDPPPVYLVEGSNDLLEWSVLAEAVEGERSSQIAVHEAEGDFSHFRISVARTRPGQVVGMREFAVYEDFSAVPAALKLASASGERKSAAVELIPVSSGEFSGEVELHEGFKILATSRLPAGFRVVQLVPTSKGAVFVTATAEDKSSAVVLRIGQTAESGLETTNFLTGLDPEVTIGWDGEWVYTLEGVTLTAFRDTDDNGMADERYRIGPIFVRSDKESASRVTFSDMRLGMDGRFYASIESAEAVPVFGKEGPLVELPENGIVSFTRAGEWLEVMVSGIDGIDRLVEDRHGDLYFQRKKSSEPPVLGDIRKVASLTGADLGFSEDEVGEFLGIGSDGRFWISEEGAIDRVTTTNERNRVAVFPGLGMVEDGGLGLMWFSFRDGGSGRESVGLLDIGTEKFAAEDMDLQRQSDLIELLDSPSHVIRREARYEVLRRRRFPQNQLLNVLSSSAGPGARGAAMTALNEAAGEVFLPHLAELSRDDEAYVRKMAFREIGRYGAAKNHPTFGAITEETRPEVTAEILGAIERTDTDAPGIDGLVLQFAASEDPVLSSSARAFLIDRESVDVCFAALDDEEKEDLWPIAFSVLADMERQSVVEGIALRLEQTRSPKMRRLALSTLTDIYYRDGSERTVWEGTMIADLMLRASVADHRVDRGFLLDRMLSERIPVKDTAELVKLGRENLPLEGVVIELLLERETPIYAERWLLEVVRGNNRDGDLRLSALTLLGTIKSPPLLREIFPILADRASFSAIPETEERAINRWVTNPAHLANVDWMVGRAKSGDAAEGSLAWHTLLSVLDDPGLDTGAVERVKAAMLATASGEEEKAMILLGALAESVYSGKEEILAKASESESVLVRNTATDLLTAPGEEAKNENELVADLSDDEILKGIGLIEWNPELGKVVFSKLSCGNCHNIHGEGPALAPDLATRVKDLTYTELATAILHPEKEVVDGYAAKEFTLTNGVAVMGHPEREDDDSINLLDTAGNRAVLMDADISEERSTRNSIMRSDLTLELTVREFASLLRYVKSLADDQ